MKVLAHISPTEAVGYITPPMMENLFFISTFGESDPDSSAPDKHGYQREPIKDRLGKIRDYYLSEGSRTTPLILSARNVKPQEIDHFTEMWNGGDIDAIHKRWGQAAASVVDGQHRYLGIVQAWKANPQYLPCVPVIINFGLSFEGEARLFDDINVNQRKLPKALIETTKAEITEVTKLDHPQRVRRIATMLARDPDSVWAGNVNLTGARDPNKPVTFEGIRRSSASMFTAEILSRLDNLGMNADQVAKDFWRIVSTATDEAWNPKPEISVDDHGNEMKYVPSYRIKELVGVASIARLGKDIIASALEHEDFNKRLTTLTNRLSYVDWEKRKGNEWMASQAGFAGQSDLYAVLYRWVYLGKRPDDE